MNVTAQASEQQQKAHSSCVCVESSPRLTISWIIKHILNSFAELTYKVWSLITMQLDLKLIVNKKMSIC
jgi:hypothetical protein